MDQGVNAGPRGAAGNAGGAARGQSSTGDNSMDGKGSATKASGNTDANAARNQEMDDQNLVGDKRRNSNLLSRKKSGIPNTQEERETFGDRGLNSTHPPSSEATIDRSPSSSAGTSNVTNGAKSFAMSVPSEVRYMKTVILLEFVAF